MIDPLSSCDCSLFGSYVRECIFRTTAWPSGWRWLRSKCVLCGEKRQCVPVSTSFRSFFGFIFHARQLKHKLSKQWIPIRIVRGSANYLKGAAILLKGRRHFVSRRRAAPRASRHILPWLAAMQRTNSAGSPKLAWLAKSRQN